MVVRIDNAWGRAHAVPNNAEVWEWVLRYANAHIYLRGVLAVTMMDNSIDDLTALGWARMAMGLWLDDINHKAES